MRTYRRRPRLETLAVPDDLHGYAGPRAPGGRASRPCDLDGWMVTDAWPERSPVTQVEVDPMEFAAVQERLRARNPKVVPPRV